MEAMRFVWESVGEYGVPRMEYKEVEGVDKMGSFTGKILSYEAK